MSAYENYCFYAYLKWLKNNKETDTCKIMKLPIIAKILLTGLLITSVMFVVFLLVGYTTITYISIGALLLCCILSSIYIEYYKVNNYEKNFNDYKKYCYKLYDFLQTLDVKKEEELIILKSGVQEQIGSITDKINRRNSNIVDWLKIVIIPVVLAAIKILMKENVDIISVVNYLMVFIIVCGVFSVISYVLCLIINISLKNEVNKYQCFADDLQGVININFGLKK